MGKIELHQDDCMEAGGSECREHILEQLPRTSEDSPSDWPGANCTFTGNAETVAKHMFRPDFQRTRAICGLKHDVAVSHAKLPLFQPEFREVACVTLCKKVLLI